MENNPNKADFYVTQVNSFSDVEQRVKIAHDTILKLNKRLTTVKECLEKTQQTCDSDLKQQISSSRNRNELIMKKMIVVYGKFEELLAMEKGRSFKRAEHEALKDQYNSI